MNYDIPRGYTGPGETAELLGVSIKTLERWRKAGKIKWIKPGARKHYYYTKEFFEEENLPQRKNYIYARVSTRGQASQLESQLKFLQDKYPTYIPIKDIGSGLNFKRKGLKTILEQASEGAVGEVVVAYKDRICRFGYEAIQWFIENKGGKIVVLDSEEASSEEELVKDLLSIITVFSARVHGLRSYKNKIKEDKTILNTKTTENN